jgi:hypothetical protein
MFPFEGARQTYEEVKKFYAVYEAEDWIQWVTGPGGHGNLGPVGDKIIGFFTRNLKGSNDAPSFTPMRLEPREDLICTPTGQVATSLGGETVYSLNRKRAAELLPPHHAVKGKAEPAIPFAPGHS